MAIQNLGRVSIVFKGAYNPETIYKRLELVYGSDGTYASRKDNNTSPLSSTNDWQKVAINGDPGTNAIPFHLQNDPVIESYSDLEDLALTLTSADADKAWVNEDDGQIYVWDGEQFASDGKGLIIPVGGKVESGDLRAVSGDEVFKKVMTKDVFLDRTNLFDKTDTSGEGFYLSATTGENVANASSSLSPVIPVKENTFYTISNRGNLSGGSTLKFMDENGTAMKPLDESGVEYTFFQTPENGTFKSPAGAVSMQFTTKFVGSGNTATLMVNEGDVALPYEDYNEGIFIKREFIKEPAPNPDDFALKVRKDGANIYVNGLVNNSSDALQWRLTTRLGVKSGSNPTTQLTGEYINGALWRASVDDICPAYVNRSYAGANHGWAFAVKIVKTSHGKTFADIGSIYKDSSNVEYVIVSIIDANNFVIVSENLATDGYSYLYQTNPNGDLVNVSGGTNTGTVSGYTHEGIPNLYTCIVNHSVVMKTDSEVITADGDYLANTFDLIESYDVLDMPSIYNKLIEGAPYSSNPNLTDLGADVLFNHNITYRFDENNNNLILHSFRAYKKLDFRFHGFLQQAPLAVSGSKIYIPGVEDMVVGSKTWKFTNEEDFDTPSATIEIKEENWIDGKPPYRFAQSNGGYRMNAGYILDKGVINDPNRAEVALMIFTSRKIYPYAKHINNYETLDAGDMVSAVAFRSVYKEDAGDAHQSVVDLKVGNERYLILDYHKGGFSEIEANEYDYGKSIEVLDKNDNVTVQSDFVQDKIIFKSNATSSDYGYAVIKIR